MSRKSFRATARKAGITFLMVACISVAGIPVASALKAVPDVSKASAPAELVVSQPSAPVGTQSTSAAAKARGLVFQGLEAGGSVCPDGLSVAGSSGLCTHGPDAAPAGIDVTQPRSTSELVAATDEGASPSSSTDASIPCYGDGVTGKRVQVVYAHAADVPDRFNDLASSLVQWAADVDKTFADSAQASGGLRHVRWVTNASCNLVIQRVQLSRTGDDSYSNTVAELESVGLKRTDRKYLLWVDANMYCGVATLYGDDSASATNVNNGGASYARVDTACWGRANSIEAHELMHLLGGVQYSAPHSSGGGHCHDAADRMCYGDGGSYFANGGKLTYPCPTAERERLFDCNNDDYFSTNPPAGSYLATHWNTASSSFLAAATPDAWSPSNSPEPAPTTSPSPSPSPTTSSTSTETYSASLNKKVSSRTYPLNVGSGTLKASLSFERRSKPTLTLLNSSGSTVASASGASPATLSSSVSAGAYSLVVSGTGNTSFTLTVTYPRP